MNTLVLTPSDKNYQICFEDETVLVVNKPSGVLSQPGKTVDGSILTQVRDAYPNATGPLLVHRLDMDTSGLLMLTKNRDAHRVLQQQFEKRKIGKRYIAVVSRALSALGGSICLPLRLDVDNRPSQIVCDEHGKPATTLWRLSSNYRETMCSRVVFTPVTGRTHQLRVHAAHRFGLNAPIVGDRLYGLPEERLMLHADMLSFNHPDTNKRITVTSVAPF